MKLSCYWLFGYSSFRSFPVRGLYRMMTTHCFPHRPVLIYSAPPRSILLCSVPFHPVRSRSDPFRPLYRSVPFLGQILSEWNSDIGQLLQLVERSCHLINKENMLHKIV